MLILTHVFAFTEGTWIVEDYVNEGDFHQKIMASKTSN